MPLTISERALLMNAYAMARQELAEDGFSVRLLSDFKQVRKEIEDAGKSVSPFFWSTYFDFNHVNGFCLVLDYQGEGMAYICTQVIDCGGMNFQEKYIQKLESIYSHDPAAELDPDWVCDPMKRISGLVAYSGDAVTNPKLRRTGTSKRHLRTISLLSLYFTLMTWADLKWIVGTIREDDWSRGLGWIYGARSIDPMAEKWITLPAGRLANYAFCSSSRDDVLWNARTTIDRLEQPAQKGASGPVADHGPEATESDE